MFFRLYLVCLVGCVICSFFFFVLNSFFFNVLWSLSWRKIHQTSQNLMFIFLLLLLLLRHSIFFFWFGVKDKCMFGERDCAHTHSWNKQFKIGRNFASSFNDTYHHLNTDIFWWIAIATILTSTSGWTNSEFHENNFVGESLTPPPAQQQQ